MANGTQAAGIRASAGSGKTYSLTTEYLKRLISGSAPAEILATTFTRKAAAEILNRILERLADAATNDKACADLAAALQLPGLTRDDFARTLAGFCRGLQDVQVCTIDSLFGRLFGAYRHRLGWPVMPAMTNPRSNIGSELLMEAVGAMLTAADGEESRALHWVEGFAGGDASRAVHDDLSGLADELDRLLPIQESAWDAFRPEPPADCETAPVVAALRVGQATGGKRLSDALLKLASLAESRDFAALGDETLICNVFRNHPKFGTTTLQPHILSALDLLAPTSMHHYTKQQAARVEAAHRLLDVLRAELRGVQVKRGTLFFSDVPVDLLAVLAEGAADEYAYRLGSGWRHVMLDEFQDTSRTQWAILKALLPGNKGDSVFWVGDPKQAIYGWRGGCAAVFDGISQAMGDPEVESRDISYRSSQVVLDAVNDTFGNLVNAGFDDDEQATLTGWCQGYREHKAVHSLDGYVHVEHAQKPSDDGDGDGEAAAQVAGDSFSLLAERVAQMQNDRPSASIGVLCQTNRQIDSAMAALRQAQIECSVEGKSSLDNCPAVELILSALTLADHPGCSAAALHLQRFDFLKLGPTATVPDRHETAKGIRTDLLRLGYPGLMRQWVRKMAPHTDAHGVGRLDQLVSLAEAYSAEANPRPSRFVAHVRTASLLELTTAPVRIMTLHAAKGLEFDVVYLMGMERRMKSRSSKLLVARESDEGEMGPITAVYPALSASPRKVYDKVEAAYNASRGTDLAEQLNLLYVGMTRAKHGLYILLGAPRPATEKQPARYDKSLAKVLVKTLAGGTISGPIIYQTGNPDWVLPTTKTEKERPEPDEMPQVRLAEEPADSSRVWRRATPSQQEGGGKVNLSSRFSLVSEEARIRGILMHGWFAAMAWSGDPPLTEAHLRRIARREAPDARPDVVAQAMADYHTAIGKPGIQEALRKPEGDAILWREQRFEAQVDGRHASGVFDRVVLMGQPGSFTSAVILDYKTGDGRADQVAFYAHQMRQYRAALSDMTGLAPEAITTNLLFTGSGKLVTVEEDEA